MRYAGTIFDLDGTLLDSLADIGTAANRVLKRLGYEEHPLEAYKYLVGDGVRVLFERALPICKNDIVLHERCISEFESIYAEEWNIRSKPYDGIVELLEKLGKRGHKLAILSNKPDSFTKKCASYFFSSIHFDIVMGHCAEFPRKPDPTSAKWIAAALGGNSNRIAYVGDTNTDMKTAVGGGLDAIGVTWGFRPESELREHGATTIVHTTDELGRILLA